MTLRILRKTATANFKKVSPRFIDDWQRDAFILIKNSLKPYEKRLDIIGNSEYYYELWTNIGYRTNSFHVKRNRGIAFVALIIYENYIGFYFLPLSINMQLNIGNNLLKFKTGQYTFHIKEFNSTVLEEINDLIKTGWNFYKENHLV